MITTGTPPAFATTARKPVERNDDDQITCPSCDYAAGDYELGLPRVRDMFAPEVQLVQCPQCNRFFSFKETK